MDRRNRNDLNPKRFLPRFDSGVGANQKEVIMKYHRDELNKIDPSSSEYYPTFKIKNENGETKWMDLHPDSVTELIEWIKRKYPNTWVQYDYEQQNQELVNLLRQSLNELYMKNGSKKVIKRIENAIEL